MKKIIFIIIIISIGVLLFLNMSLFTWSNNKEIIKKVELHNWKPFSELLNKKNYDKVWINPDKYTSFSWFLVDFKTFSWVLINPVKEKFVIWLKQKDWNILYIPFDYKNNKNIFSKKEYKNLAILDIYKAYKEGWIYWWVDSSYWSKILFEEDMQHSKTSILNNIFTVNINDQSNNVYKIQKELEQSAWWWISNKELLAYLDDFTWDYKKANEERKKLCLLNKKVCTNNISLNLIWKIKDSNWKWVAWAKVTLLNNNNIFAITDDKWNYKIDFKYYNFSHLRFKASFKWYSDWFTTYSLNNTFNKKLNLNIDINIQKSNDSFVLNSKTISNFKKGRYFIIKDKNSKYFVPRDGLYFENWDNYKLEDFTVYTYLFTKTTSSESMLANDTFSPVYWYVWNIMKTFWMPYIQFIDNVSWKELFIRSSNPMILQNHIYHMKELYNNHDKIYEKVTDSDMDFLVKTSETLGWYPITFNFLIKNNLLRWPVWWVLDRKTWIWGSVWSRVLDVSWFVELPFYSIKDN